MSKHTSGPWTIGEEAMRSSNGPEVVPIHGNGIVVAELPAYFCEERPMRDANARLIAAAPELLAALERTLAALRLARVYIPRDGTEERDAWDASDDAIADADTAIARAEGK